MVFFKSAPLCARYIEMGPNEMYKSEGSLCAAAGKRKLCAESIDEKGPDDLPHDCARCLRRRRTRSIPLPPPPTRVCCIGERILFHHNKQLMEATDKQQHIHPHSGRVRLNAECGNKIKLCTLCRSK